MLASSPSHMLAPSTSDVRGDTHVGQAGFGVAAVPPAEAVPAKHCVQLEPP